MNVSKKLIALICGAILAVVLIAAAIVWAAPVFKVGQYSITGNTHITNARVEEAAGVPLGANLVRVDARAAAAGIAEIPWVSSATVSRQFPDTLSVEITERDAVAFRNEHDGPHLIDAHGEEFFIDTPPETAVEITGKVEPNSQSMADAVEVIAAVPAKIRAQVKSLDVRGPYSMTFVLKDKRTVFWGANEDNANKARAFATVLKMEGQNWDITNPELVTTR